MTISIYIHAHMGMTASGRLQTPILIGGLNHVCDKWLAGDFNLLEPNIFSIWDYRKF